jgi:hypothetical protein
MERKRKCCNHLATPIIWTWKLDWTGICHWKIVRDSGGFWMRLSGFSSFFGVSIFVRKISIFRNYSDEIWCEISSNFPRFPMNSKIPSLHNARALISNIILKNIWFIQKTQKNFHLDSEKALRVLTERNLWKSASKSGFFSSVCKWNSFCQLRRFL